MSIKENNKVLNGKSIIISEDIHTQFRNYCKRRGYKISFVVEEMITHLIKQGTYISEIPELEEELKK